MTPVEYVVTAAAAAVIVAVGNAIYQALKGTPTSAGDEGPIRVKGGSVYVDAPTIIGKRTRATDTSSRTRTIPNLRFWSGRVFVDGVPSNQWNGRVVEIDLMPMAGGNTKTLKCQVKGGIRVTPANDLVINPSTTSACRTRTSTSGRSDSGEPCALGLWSVHDRRTASSSRS